MYIGTYVQIHFQLTFHESSRTNFTSKVDDCNGDNNYNDCGNDNDDCYSDDSDNDNDDENEYDNDFWVLEASAPQLMTGSLFPPSSDLLDSFNVFSYTSSHSSHPTFIFFNEPFLWVKCGKCGCWSTRLVFHKSSNQLVRGVESYQPTK